MMRNPQTLRRIALGALLLVGLALRLFRLGADSLWYDETVSVYLAGSPLSELIRHTAGDIHPPGYYVLLRAWLRVMGLGDGRATADGSQLEWAAGFFSVFFGVVLIALGCVFARRLAGASAGLFAAALIALSAYNIWYSQEVRMYTLAALLGILAVYAMHRALIPSTTGSRRGMPRLAWWLVYGLAAAAGMYTLYYLLFLLIPLNIWAAWESLRARGERRMWGGWLMGNLLALVLYLPWLPRAIRQITDPPVPPWRSPTSPVAALAESWRAISLGQSAPEWTIPVALLVLAVFLIGLVTARPRSLVGLVTLGPFLLILIASVVVAPLYHVRYVFPFTPAVYATMAIGETRLWRRWRPAAAVIALLWLAGSAATLHAFWTLPAYRADNHRQAVHDLYARWRPGDAVLVNAGYAYTALATYWPGKPGVRARLSDALPAVGADDALLMLTTGHVDGSEGLGWGDQRSDFYAMPAETAAGQIAAAFAQYPRLWHYRVYDTVTDPEGVVRAALDAGGVMAEDRTYTGEASLRLQSFVPRAGTAWDASLPETTFENGIRVQWQPIERWAAADETIAAALTWLPDGPVEDFATSIRLVGADGAIWAQPEDERPLGPLFSASQWPPGQARQQTVAVEVPVGAPPGTYAVQLVVYDPLTGRPLAHGTDEPLMLGQVMVAEPATSAPLPAVARFGPLRLLEARTPATRISPGDAIPVELLWQAGSAPAEPLVIVLQLVNARGEVVAGVEEEPLQGSRPTQAWETGAILRDRHSLQVPADVTPGTYTLVLGVYRAADRERLKTARGLLPGASTHPVAEIVIGP